MSTPQVYSVPTASQAIGVSDSTLRNWFKRGLIEGIEDTGTGKGPGVPAKLVYELAFTAELIATANCQVGDAFRAMRDALSSYEGFEWWQLPPKLYVFPNTLEGVVILDGEDPRLSLYAGSEFTDWRNWNDTFLREFGVSKPQGDPLHPFICDGTSHIILYPHSVVRRTKRVLESAR